MPRVLPKQPLELEVAAPLGKQGLEPQVVRNQMRLVLTFQLCPMVPPSSGCDLD